MCSPNKNDEEIVADDVITTYPHGTSIVFIKYFDDTDKDRPNSTEELKKIYNESTDK